MPEDGSTSNSRTTTKEETADDRMKRDNTLGAWGSIDTEVRFRKALDASENLALSGAFGPYEQAKAQTRLASKQGSQK